MRGKVVAQDFEAVQAGITPAYAGKSPLWGTGAKPLWDHPRVCGEKRAVDGNKTPAGGSPPRMRGKVKQKNLRVKTEGITPAYAGKRGRCDLCARRIEDHPRVCGEKGL